MFGLALFEMLFIVVFGGCLLYSVLYDRRGYEAAKWWVLIIGGALVAAMYWSHWVFVGPSSDPSVLVLWDWLRAGSFIEPILAFIGIGLLYSIVEFFVEVRRSASAFRAAWDSYLNRKIPMQVFSNDGTTPLVTEAVRTPGGRAQPSIEQITVRDLLTEARLLKQNGTTTMKADTYREMAYSVMNEFGQRYSAAKFIEAARVDLEIEPKVNRGELASHIGAWTLFWPAYALTLVFDRLLSEIARIVADLLARVSTQFVKITFQDVFKV